MDFSEPLFSFEARSVAQLALSVFVLCYLIFSAIFVYHWRKYAIDQRIIKNTLLGYFASTLTLILVAFVTMFFI